MAILVCGIDKPKKCSECAFSHMNMINRTTICQIISEEVPRKTDMLPDETCPIIQMPLNFKLIAEKQ